MQYILPLMFLIMFTLKLTGVIDMSWWLVCSPLFPMLGFLILAIFGALARGR